MEYKYIDAEKLIAEIKRFRATEYGGDTLGDDAANGALDYVLEEIIPSLQREAEEERKTRLDEIQKISIEYRDSVIKHIEAKRVLPSFRGQLLHDFKNELNTMKQILNIQMWPQNQYAIFEKVALAFAAWGGYHFHPKESLPKDEHQQEQLDEQPEYGYLSTEYVHGRKPRWNVGDVLAYYICTSNEEGEYPLGKIVSVEFDEEDGWVYTFEDESTWDEQSLVEEEAYKKN